MLRRFSLVALALLTVTSLARAAEVDLPRWPSLSPDGGRVVFTWRGDLWSVSSQGGQAVRLTSHPADDTRSCWSPDGRWIAFNSTRSGELNVHLMRPDGTGLRQVTRSDNGLWLTAFGPQSDEVLVSARREGDVYRDARNYRVSLQGGPLRRVHDAFGRGGCYSPSGKRFAFTRGGSAWSRRGYRGPDARELWLRDGDRFTRLTDWPGNDGLARWRDEDTLVFASDRELDTVNLYSLSLGSGRAARRLTGFQGQDVQSFDVSADGRLAVLVAWDRLHTLDLTAAGAAPQPLRVTAPQDEADRFVLQPVGREVSEAALHPGGEALAFVAYGEVFVRALEDHSPTRQVTQGHAREQGLAWSPDGTRLYFVSDQDGTESIYAATVTRTRGEVKDAYAKATAPAPTPSPAPTPEPASGSEEEPAPGEGGEAEGDAKPQAEQAPKPAVRWADALEFQVVPVVQAASHDREPSPSPDGAWLAFRRGRGDLALLELASGEVKMLRQGWDTGLHWRWSPDSRHLAFAVSDRDFNTDVWVAPVDGSSWPVNVSMHPDSDWAPRWSADGKVLAFLSSRQDDEADVWMVYLDRRLEALTPKERAAYYAEAKKAAGKREPLPPPSGEPAVGVGAEGEEEVAKPTAAVQALDLEDAYLRLRRVTDWQGSERGLELTPGGDTFVVKAQEDDGGVLYALSWDGETKTRLAGEVEIQHLSLSGDSVVVVDGGRAALVPVGGGKVEHHAPDAKLRVDLGAQSSQKFREAARILAESFYHPTMKGLDWSALTERYHGLAARAHTADEFRDVASRLIGELNGSHLGIYPPSPPKPNREANGRLGVDVTPVAEGFRVDGLVPQGPAETGSMRLQVGDVLLAINGVAFTPRDTLASALRGQVGREVLVSVRRAGDGGDQELELLLTPIAYGAEANLRYAAWQRANARKVADWSGGRLGYLHIRGMNGPSLVEFERDLYAAAYKKDGLLIDVRNNGGGWTADLVLASLTVRPHAYTVPRGADPSHTDGYPQGRLFIQRYTKPVNMLCNEKSFSNAEILSHAFKTLGRGTLVGEQTYGGVISTGSASLIDGTRVRVPFRGWYLPDGTDMENHGAVPDLRVPQTPEDEVAGFDRQLKAAVDDLLERLD
jgi:tricorn protease